MSKSFTVHVSLADLRKESIPAKFCYDRDFLQETQLLYGESVNMIAEEGEWFYIEALEQLKYSKERGWGGYQGWILKSQVVESKYNSNPIIVSIPWASIHLEPSLKAPLALFVSMGTRLEFLETWGEWQIIRLANGQKGAIPCSSVIKPPKKLSQWSRKNILAMGSALIGMPYLWGGRSIYRADWKDQLTSCDCSGLTNLLYRVHGIDLPRDAHDQFLFCQKREFHELQSADLIFLASKERPERIVHVMLYAGEDLFLDTNMKDHQVVKTSARERFGKPFGQMKWGELLEKDFIYFGERKENPMSLKSYGIASLNHDHSIKF